MITWANKKSKTPFHSHKDDVSLFSVGGDGASDGGEPVRVENGLLRAEEGGELLLEVNVDV